MRESLLTRTLMGWGYGELARGFARGKSKDGWHVFSVAIRDYFSDMENHPLDGETICALSTPHGIGGIAVVRVSGPSAWSIVQGFSRRSWDRSQAGSVVLSQLFDGDQVLDEALLLPFAGPASFTGEDIVECHVHGSPFIQQRLLEMLIEAGCRMALPGEFTQRAFLHGKRDLAQSEAIGDLIHAEHAGAHRLAVEQLSGGFSAEIASFREQLLSFAALMELELDFGEEDVEFADRPGYRRLLTDLLARIDTLIGSFSTGRAIAEGVPVVILGAPNRGKSTLLNALLQEDRAIVSATPGTTRDVIEQHLTLHGIRFRFNDTAGLRETTDEIESEGIRRALNTARAARFVIYLLDAQDLQTPAGIAAAEVEVAAAQSSLAQQSSQATPPQWLLLINKTDLAPAPDPLPTIAGLSARQISAEERQGLTELEAALTSDYVAAMDSRETLVTNLRHQQALVGARSALGSALEALDAGLSGDLIAVDNRAALAHLGRITGVVTPDDLLGHIFANFCIGK
jgi:tRNA modification GTPase